MSSVDENDIRELDLSGKVIHLYNWEDGLSVFYNLKTLNLSHNLLENIYSLNLHVLPSLHCLDLRENKFESLESIIGCLRSCDNLKILYIHNSTHNDETHNKSKYIHTVFKELRNLEDCDDVKNHLSLVLNPLDILAAKFFKQLMNVGPNSLNRINLRNKNLSDILFLYIISALKQLETSIIWLDGNNEWVDSPEYTDIVIVCLIKNLRYLDDIEITDDRRRLALNANKTKKYDTLLVPWTKCHEKAFELLNENIQFTEIEKIINDDRQYDDQLIDRLNHSIRQKIDVVHVISSRASIITNYWQIYGIITTLHVGNIYPDSWVTFNTITSALNFNIDRIYHINGNYQTAIIFSMLVTLPIVLIGIFYLINLLKSQKETFIDNYINKWHRICFTYISIFVIWIIAFSISIALINIELITAWGMLIFSFIISLFFLWVFVIVYFRHRWYKDESINKTDFGAVWFNVFNLLQTICLFGISYFYMPLCNNIFSHFECVNGTDQLYPLNNCFPSTITAEQIAALIFGCIYIIGIPIFNCHLIHDYVKQIIASSREYKMINERLDNLTDRNEIERLNKIKKLYYYAIITNGETSTPVSDLFCAYRERYRYWIVAKMNVILALLFFNFIPNDVNTVNSSRDMFASILLFCNTIVLMYIRPYHEPIENIMDCAASFANFCNSLITFGINENFPNFTAASITLLFAINLPVIAILGYGIISGGYKAYKKKKQMNKQSTFDSEEEIINKQIELAEKVHENKLNSNQEINNRISGQFSLNKITYKTLVPVYNHKKGVKSILLS